MKRKTKHLLGKKNNNSPWVWGLIVSANNILFAETVSVNNILFAETVSVNNLFQFFLVSSLMLIYLFVLGAWMVYVTRDGMGGGDLSSTQTDELFWSKVIQITGCFIF